MRKIDPLVRAVKKAYRESNVGQFEALVKEHSKWRRRENIARNKRLSVYADIEEFALRLAKETDGAK